MRGRIDASLGPVWEANHVWLIFILVYLWGGFPRAFAAITTTLAVPFAIVGLGVVFRGGAFVFRKSSATLAGARLHGVVFAVSSLVTPFFLGTIAGAVAGGRVPLGGGDPLRSWTGPLSLAGGMLAVLTCSFLAATLLAADAQRSGEAALSAAFRRRALAVGVVTGTAALLAAATIGASAPALAAGLRGRAAPLVVLSAIAGLSALVDLRAARLERARWAAFAAVGSIVAGWGVAQYPAILVGSADISDVAAHPAVLDALAVVAGVGGLVVVPSLAWLLRLTQRPPDAGDGAR
jgi:cytochrome d ubiquinol oxidase subunit II